MHACVRESFKKLKYVLLLFLFLTINNKPYPDPQVG